MHILNTKNPYDVAKIYVWLIPTDSETRMAIAAELRYRLTNTPEDTLVQVAIERNITRAVQIAYVSDNQKHVWLWQSHAEPGFRYSRIMFDGLINWSRARGAKEIRMGPNGHERVFQRIWGFEPLKNGDMRLKVA